MKLMVRQAGNGEAVEVELRRNGAGFRVDVGGHSYTIDRVEANESVRSYLIDGRQYELTVRPEGERTYQVGGPAGLETVEVLDPLTLLAEQAHAASGAGASHQVKAYMPGRVVAVLAEEGSPVSAGQGVLVLEAMKMENEIQAEGEGVITRMLVEPGQAVEGGDPLFEIGPGA